jgi:predicted esterase
LNPLKNVLALLLVVSGVTLILFSEAWMSLLGPPWFRKVILEISTVCQDPGMWWLILTCAAIYFIAFTIIGSDGKWYRMSYQRLLSPNLWFCLFLLINVFANLTNFEQAKNYKQTLVLLIASVVGKGVQLWVRRKSSLCETRDSKHQFVLAILLLGLVGASVWPRDGVVHFQYGGLSRWSGPWDNPNVFELFMGVGVVVGIGLALASLFSPASHTANWSRRSWRLLLLLAVIMCGCGLLKSYSRGAWLGTAIGIAVISQANLRFVLLKSGAYPHLTYRILSYLRRNIKRIGLLIVALIVISFWGLRDAQIRPVRRAFSVGNQNDFSWRNRLVAWEGALAMMADKPLTGFGWSRLDCIYEQFYSPPKIIEGAAIQMNHCFLLGAAVGVPALLCFGLYLGLSYRRSCATALTSADIQQTEMGQAKSRSLSITCGAGALVLLLGFWFDGGLFHLAIAIVFWTFLELSQSEVSQAVDNSCRRYFPFFAVSSLFLIVLFTGLIWAKARSPFHREWMTLKAPNNERFASFVVRPKGSGPFPVVIFLHGANRSAYEDGDALQQFATLGMAAVGVEYDQTSQMNFNFQFARLLDELVKKSWVQSNAIAWVGHSLGAQRELSFLITYPKSQPAVLVRLAGGVVDEMDNESEYSNFKSNLQLNSHVWIAHGAKDTIFPLETANRVGNFLRRAGAKVRLSIFESKGHWFNQDQPLLVQQAASFCANVFGRTEIVPVNMRPSLWYYWLPAALWCGILMHGSRLEKACVATMGTNSNCRLKFVTVGVFGISLLISGLHLILPLCTVNTTSLRLARFWCVQPELRQDFDWLARQPEASNTRICELLNNLQLASLQRGQFTADLSGQQWREFVLSPWIEPATHDVGWRRDLWESFYPLVRRETDVEHAAIQIARHLKLSIYLSNVGRGDETIIQCWRLGTVNASQRELLHTAVLRAVGIPARIGIDGRAQVFYSGCWKNAPQADEYALNP